MSQLWSRKWADYLLTEADGSARRPIKAPDQSEPVVPAETTLFISIFGLSALGQPLNQDSSFRPEIISRLTGLSPGSLISPEVIFRLATHPSGGLKGWGPGMRAVCLLNQRDSLPDQHLALNLAESIHRQAPILFDRVIISRLIPKRHFTVTRW